MPQSSASLQKHHNGREGKQNPSRVPSPQKARDRMGSREKLDTAEMKDYKLGDCLGKGAFGAVYRGLNWSTGETVAIKQIKLSDLAKTELRTIMLEIDLLKNLNHPNIVKYHGFVKSTESLNIILEYCENGSLHSICKSFGKFPENLVGLYMSQVLNGLLYLHEQGVIHRDIKGANILTTKEGLVKLADFGVATKATGLHESNVVGTPYWMAPEVIELSGATTASDIWSLGCTVIELLDGKPPYHKLQPMPALFRIVNDDHPPLPESISPSVQDFLMQCFQKDPNLRVSAKKLLRHPWIASAKRADAVVPVKPTTYDNAVKSVQEWNEALKSPEATMRHYSPAVAKSLSQHAVEPSLSIGHSTASRNEVDGLDANTRTELFRSPDLTESDNWDDDFASSISSSALQLPHLRPVDKFDGALSPEKLKAYATVEPDISPSKSSDIFSTAKDMLTPDLSDPFRSDILQTVRPHSPRKQKHERQRSDKEPSKVSQRVPSQPKTQILRPTSSNLPTQLYPRPRGLVRSSSLYRENSVEDYSDLVSDDDVDLDQKLNEVLKSKHDKLQNQVKPVQTPTLFGDPRSMREKRSTSTDGETNSKDQIEGMRRTQSSLEIQKYSDKVEDSDYSDIFGGGSSSKLSKAESESGSDADMAAMLNSKFSTNSWLGDDEEEDDPFAKLEEELGEMDLKTKVARDKYARMCASVEGLITALKAPDEFEDDEDKVGRESDLFNLADTAGQLFAALYEMPELRQTVISSHGLLPILEVLDNCQRHDISLPLLKVVNIILLEGIDVLENFCFVGGIPTVTQFAHRKYPNEIRLEAAAFVRHMYQSSTLVLQMFIACGGLYVLVEFLDEDYETDRDLVLIGVNGVSSVFDLQGPTPKSDFCRIFSRTTVLRPLSLLLNRALDEGGSLAELVEARIVNIFYLFSQAENLVKERVADRLILNTVLNNLRRMSVNHQVTMLKFIKNLSMLATTLDSLHNANTIETLTHFLRDNMKSSHFKEISNQVLNIMFNLCRLSKRRQEDAALAGLIPLLQRIVSTDRPLKEFALPILCDMAHSGKMSRMILGQNKGLQFFISLLSDPYWQVTALDAIFVWLQEETARVETHLQRDDGFSTAITACFIHSKTDAFENLLEPLQKLLRLSPPIAASLSNPDIFDRTAQRLNNKKAVVRGNLLRIIRSICEASEQLHQQAALLQRFDLYDDVRNLAENDPAILVRNMAMELVKYNDASARISHEGVRLRPSRRTSSSNAAQTPPSLYATTSQPPTPQHGRGGNTQPIGYFDMIPESSPRHTRASLAAGSTPYRPLSRDGSGGSKLSSSDYSSTLSSGGPQMPVRSKLPRTKLGSRPSLSNLHTDSPTPLWSGNPTVNGTTPTGPGNATTGRLYNPRRRRQTSGAIGGQNNEGL